MMAESTPRVRRYESDAVVVTFEPRLCIHAEECVRGLPAVFDIEKRPWAQPQHAGADEVVEVVSRCPTGALHTERLDGGPAEAPVEDVTIREAPNGSLYVSGPVSVVDDEDGVFREDQRIALCRCGASKDRPFCDGSHTEAGFTA